MAISHAAGATASTVSATPKTLPVPQAATATGESVIPPAAKDAGREHVRYLLFGSASAVQTTIRRLPSWATPSPIGASQLQQVEQAK